MQVGTVNLQSLIGLASEPKWNNTFMIENYDGLNRLLDQLQNKIYSVEGNIKLRMCPFTFFSLHLLLL